MVSALRASRKNSNSQASKAAASSPQCCCVLESDLDHREDGLDQLVLGMQRAGGRPDLGQARGA